MTHPALEICTEVLRSMTLVRMHEPDAEFTEIVLNYADWETIRLYRDDNYPEAAAAMTRPTFMGLPIRAESYIRPGDHIIVADLQSQSSTP